MTTFLPWVRSGVAARLPVADEPGAALTNAAEVDVTLDVTGVAPAPVKLRPYGPGDVTAVDAAQIVRCEPPDGTTTFDPDHFPAVELDAPDLPWLFTPAAPTATGRLRPWFVLVVVADRPGVAVEPHESGRLPVLRIGSPARPADELPPLDESWAWAHAQVLDDGAGVDDALARRPLATLSRLIAPRRLEPYRRYIACLVPAFEAGRQAGLGLPADGPDAALAPAWTSGTATVALPVYHHWTFATGRGDDFRALARKLRPGRLAPDAGTRPMSVPSLTGGEDLEVALEGALTTTGHVRAPAPDPGWAEALRKLVESGEDVVAPPRYGAWYVDEPRDSPATRAAGLPREGEAPPWLREVNLDPRERAAAGLGARVVERIREQLVAEAWAQAAQVVEARRLHERARLSGAVGERVVERHLEPLDLPALLRVTAPAHPQLADTAGGTIGTLLDDHGYPTDVTNPALRRLARPDGPVGDLLPHAPQQARLGASLARAVGEVSRGVGVVTRPPGLATLSSHGLEGATADAVNVATPPAGWTPSDPAAPAADGSDAAAAERFQKAAAHHLEHLEATTEAAAGDDAAVWPWMGDADVRQRLLDGLDPHAAGRRRLGSRVSVGEALPVARPVIGRAMYTALNDIAARLLLPGAASLEPESVCAAVTNPRFIEAFMLGLNHEANRLLLWRGVPIDRRAMPFQRFWRSADTGEPPELPAVDDWPAGSSLGEHLLHTPHGRAGAGGVVLVIRGELFRRHPSTTVYARRAVWSDGVRKPADGDDDPADNAYPRVHGRIGDDAALVGLFVDADGTVLDEAAVRGGDDDAGDAGWFFLLQEHPAEPRFGLAPPPDGDAPRRATWADMSWADLPDAAPYVPVNGGAPDTSWVADPGGASWGATAADMAVITLRRPYRAAVHARALVAAPAGAGI